MQHSTPHLHLLQRRQVRAALQLLQHELHLRQVAQLAPRRLQQRRNLLHCTPLLAGLQEQRGG